MQKGLWINQNNNPRRKVRQSKSDSAFLFLQRPPAGNFYFKEVATADEYHTKRIRND
jgi:hypothetical protein